MDIDFSRTFEHEGKFVKGVGEGTENYYLPGELDSCIKQFVEYYNHERYHESQDNLTPADVYYGRGEKILNWRAKIKTQALAERRRLYYQQKAA